MALPETYTDYPKRGYGMDQDRYAWRLSIDRPALSWPAGASVAAMVVVPIEFHMLNPTGKPFKHPGAMVTPYPDMRHFTSRDYGNRVGVFRILKVLKAAGITATFPINAVLLRRIGPLLEILLAEGHEIAAYGLDTDHIHHGGLDIATERAWIADTRAAFDAVGLTPRAWMSPARQQSFATLDLIAEAGFTVCLDWEQDSAPVMMKTATAPVSAVPLSSELDDRLLLGERRQTEDEWRDQILEACAFMKTEALRFGGQVLGFTLTPYIAGQPFRTAALRQLLHGLGGDEAVWSAGASQIAAAAAAA